jgi:hypothetical protein
MFVGGVGGTTAPSPNIPTWFPRGGEPNVPGDDIGRAREDVREPTAGPHSRHHERPERRFRPPRTLGSDVDRSTRGEKKFNRRSLTRETGVRGEKRPSRIREGPRKFAKRGDENLYGDRDSRNQGSRAHLETGGGE